MPLTDMVKTRERYTQQDEVVSLQWVLLCLLFLFGGFFVFLFCLLDIKCISEAQTRQLDYSLFGVFDIGFTLAMGMDKTPWKKVSKNVPTAQYGAFRNSTI